MDQSYKNPFSVKIQSAKDQRKLSEISLKVTNEFRRQTWTNAQIILQVTCTTLRIKNMR